MVIGQRSVDGDDAEVPAPTRKVESPWPSFAVSALGVFLVVSALSSLNVALPNLQTDLGATARDLQWIVDAYAIVFGGLLLTGGAVGDRLGRRTSLAIGFGVLIVGNLIGAFAGTVAVVVAARLLAGVGAALMLPATLSLITDVFSGVNQARAIAIWAGVAGAGGAVGPVLGGWLLEWSWWGAVFLTNAVLAGCGLIGALFVVPRLPLPPRRRLDPLGSLLSLVAVGCILFAAIEAPGGWSRVEVVASLVIGVFALWVFLWHERRTDEPMLPLRVFAPSRVRVGSWTLLLAAVGFNGVLFVSALWLQFGWGESPLTTGLLILPIGIVEFLVSTQSVSVARRVGTGRAIAIGLGSMAIGYLAMASVGVGDRLSFVLAGMVAGVGNGLVIPLSVERVVGGDDGELAGVRAGVNETAIELGASFGVALLGGVQRVVFAQNLPNGVPNESFVEAFESASEDVAVEAGAVLDAFVESGRAALVVAALLVVVAAPWAVQRVGDEP